MCGFGEFNDGLYSSEFSDGLYSKCSVILFPNLWPLHFGFTYQSIRHTCIMRVTGF